jgi:hypothetical protein
MMMMMMMTTMMILIEKSYRPPRTILDTPPSSPSPRMLSLLLRLGEATARSRRCAPAKVGSSVSRFRPALTSLDRTSTPKWKPQPPVRHQRRLKKLALLSVWREPKTLSPQIRSLRESAIQSVPMREYKPAREPRDHRKGSAPKKIIVHTLPCYLTQGAGPRDDGLIGSQLVVRHARRVLQGGRHAHLAQDKGRSPGQSPY